MRSRPAAVAALLLLAASPAGAQQLFFRVGGVHARYADTVSGTAGVLSSRLAWDGRRTTGTVGASLTQFSGGLWAAQTAGSVFGIRLLTPTVGLGVRAEGEAGYIEDGAWSAIGSAGPVFALVSGSWLYSAGLGFGAVRRVDRLGDATVAGNVMVRRDAGPFSLEGTLAATRAGLTRIADATLSVTYQKAAWTVSGLAGARSGNLGGQPWYQGRLAFQATPWATIEFEAGSYPPDLSGFTNGRYLALGVWLGAGARRRVPDLGPATSLGAEAQRGVTIETIESGHQRVTFVVPGASRVAIAGEWNDWTPVALHHVDGPRWQVDLALSQGAHRFSLVVDGGRWMVPQGVASLPDDMGGRVGLLLID